MLKTYLENRNIRLGLWAAGIVAVILFMWLTSPRVAGPGKLSQNVNGYIDAPVVNGPSTNSNVPAGSGSKNTNTKKPVGFVEKKTPHFVSSNIANNVTLNAVPQTITITFDAVINKTTESFVTVKRDQIYSATLGSSYIGSDGKTLSVNLNPQVANGDYYIYYVACFADVGCKDGRFGYHIKLP